MEIEGYGDLTTEEISEYDCLLDKMMYGAPMTRKEWSRMVELYNKANGRADVDSDKEYDDYCKGDV